MAVEAEVADIGAALCVDDHVVAKTGGDRFQFRLDGELAIGEAHQALVGHAHDQHRAVGSPAKTGRTARNLDDRLGLAALVGGVNLMDVEVRVPELALMPARALAEAQAVDEGFEFHFRTSHSILKALPSGLM